LVCGRRPADARFAQSPALGRKVSDEFTVPLCRGHHREVHRCGDEAAWWVKSGIKSERHRAGSLAEITSAAERTRTAASKLRNMAVIARADGS
jgi:hypothetical protein